MQLQWLFSLDIEKRRCGTAIAAVACYMIQESCPSSFRDVNAVGRKEHVIRRSGTKWSTPTFDRIVNAQWNNSPCFQGTT